MQVNETLTIDWESAHPPRAVGWRREDRGLLVRELWALRDGVPVQCTDGKIDARAMPDI